MSHTAPGRAPRTRGRAARVIALVALTACGTEPRGADTTSSASASASAPTKPHVTELWLGGDVHWGAARALEGRFDPALARELAGATGFVNVEGPVTRNAGPGARTAPDGTVTLTNDAAALASLRGLGVGLASIANNHAMDLGEDGLPETRALLEVASVRAVGIDAASPPSTTVVLGGATVHFAAWNLRAVATDPPGAPANADELRARARDAELSRLGTEPGVLIVSFHDTGPPSYLPSTRLREAVDAAVRAGADVVVSHGTHAIAPVERRGGAVIAWGLGNLLFHCECTRERDGLVLRVRVADGDVTATVTPIDAGLDGAPATLSHDAALMFDLLDALGSSPLRRDGVRASI